ncbi:hypothetical protein J8281_12820 [Aquimarina sp. U1-2]|uniref:hypothetical protein n=1 Tax=Aquimarina sp. U1-2 TaxID=2823141 RepID=UPI001AECF9E6|nr:hypothetical protein [Aquimarina sp. U1-2]MBP2833071.1 hypothetical protein [Aquimarina sp. U1-2]
MKKNNTYKKNSGFTTPKGYFDSFDKRVSKSLDTHLDQSIDIIKNTGFTVPNDYFNTFEIKITNSTTKSKRNAQVVPLFFSKNVTPIIGIAAILVILISISVFRSNKDPLKRIETMDLATIQNYILENSMLSKEDIIFSLEEINDTYVFEESTLTKEELLDYISDNDVIDTIIYSN